MIKPPPATRQAFRRIAGAIFWALLASSGIAVFSTANADDEDSDMPWRDFQQVIEKANSPHLQDQVHLYKQAWLEYVRHELVDGTHWQFRDKTHAATEGLIETHKWEKDGFGLWGRSYDVRHIQIRKVGKSPDDIELSRPVDKGIDAGTHASFLISASSPSGNHIHLVYKNTLTGKKIFDDTIKLTPERNYYEQIHVLPENRPGEYTLAYDLAEDPGKINLYYMSFRDIVKGRGRDVVARHMIEDTIRSREGDDDSIIRYRTGMLTILVRDKSGQPVPTASVGIEQTRHYFLFGCNLDGLKLDDHSEFQRNYQKRFAELFNYAKIPCYWNEIESAPGKRDYAKISAMAKWCTTHGLRKNGYGLVSLFHCPAWAPTDFREGVGLLRATVIDCVKQMCEQINSWDVADELGLAVKMTKPNVLTRWLKQEGEAKVTEQAYFWATYGLGDRKQTLIVNSTGGSFLAVMAQHGTLPEAIGCPLSMREQIIPLAAVSAGLKRTESLRKPIFMTDLAILSGPTRPVVLQSLQPASDWNSTVRGEQWQADYVAKVYSLLFSNPQIVSISWRDFSDQGAWLGAPAGLLRRDGTPKPAYTALMKLIHKQWWTVRPPGPVDRKGTISFAAFFGDYTITVNDGKGHIIKKQISFTPDSKLQAQIITVGN